MITRVATGPVGGHGRAADLWLHGDRIGPPAADPDLVLDVTGLTLLPGWIDLQVNGAFGIDLTADPGGLWDLAARLPATGVTAFLPTLVSPSTTAVEAALDVLAAGPPAGWAGSLPLGWHLEGPFIDPAHRGTHPAHAVRPVDHEEVRGWTREAGVAVVTLAPELPGAAAATRLLTRAGVVVAAGHSGADHDTARAAVDTGVRAVTHCFNAMPPLHHRAPGLAGAALTDPRVAVGLIADGLHVHPTALGLAAAAAGGRIHLVTDAMAAAGLDPGRYRLGEVEVVVGDAADGAAAGPRNPDGGLAGSAATYDHLVRTWMAATGARAPDLAAVTSTTAADLLDDAGRGRLTPGARGDLTALDPDGRVVLTVVGGRVLHDARETAPPTTTDASEVPGP